MNEQELKEAIEKSNIETEAKAELIEILETHGEQPIENIFAKMKRKYGGE